MDVQSQGTKLDEQALARDFEQAYLLLPQFADFERVDELYPSPKQTVFTNAVLMWMLIMQQMGMDKTLTSTVKMLLDYRPEFLPNNKRSEENSISSATGGYSNARSKMKFEIASWFASEVTQSLIKTTQPTYHQRRVFTIDGTTLTLVNWT